MPGSPVLVALLEAAGAGAPLSLASVPWLEADLAVWDMVGASGVWVREVRGLQEACFGFGRVGGSFGLSGVPPPRWMLCRVLTCVSTACCAVREAGSCWSLQPSTPAFILWQRPNVEAQRTKESPSSSQLVCAKATGSPQSLETPLAPLGCL